MIFQLGAAIGPRAMGAAVNASAFLDVVADDATTAIPALGREGMDGALKAVEDMLPALHHHFERFFVVVSANFTLSHVNGSCVARRATL